jgi:hypothetical protein
MRFGRAMWSAVLNGVVAVPVMVMIMMMRLTGRCH